MSGWRNPLRRAHRRGEGGFALLAMLAVIGLVSVIILALLGLTLTSTTYSTQQRIRDAQTRSADSAIDSVLYDLATGSPSLGSSTAPGAPECVLAPKDPTTQLPTVDVGGEKVAVTCTPLPTDGPLAATGPDPNNPLASAPGLGQVFVVGQRYRYNACDPDTPTAANNLNCYDFTNPPGSALGTSAGGYTRGTNVVSGQQVGATLLHSGPGSLKFTANVEVWRGASAINTKPSVGPTQSGPAIAVSGSYAQGDPGLGAIATNRCGAQSPLSAETRGTWIEAALAFPRCDVPAVAAKATTALAGTGGVPLPAVSTNPPVVWGPTVVAAKKQTPPATCPPGNLVRLNPGSYTGAEADRLNAWFGPGNCDNKVFQFLPGDYYFDVDSATNGAPFRNSLIFNDPTSVVVFGSPAEGQWPVSQAVTPTSLAGKFADEKGVCTNGPSSGVSITLTTRTTIDHRQGRVAICDRRTTSSAPATSIFQSGASTPPFGPAAPVNPVTPSPTFIDTLYSNNYGVNLQNAQNVVATDGAVASAPLDCPVFSVIFPLWRNCREAGGQTFVDVPALSLQSSIPPAIGANAIDSLSVDVKAPAPDRINTQAMVFEVFVNNIKLDNSPNPARGSCFARFQAAKDVQRTEELLDPSAGNCSVVIRDLGNLSGATFRVGYVNLTAKCFFENRFPYQCSPFSAPPSLRIDSISFSARSTVSNGSPTAPFRVTSNNSVSGSNLGAVFRAEGVTSLPLSDLHVRWAGPALQRTAGASVPLQVPVFGAQLIANAIASSAGSAGVPGNLCCVAAQATQRSVRLDAWVGVQRSGSNNQGRLRSTAVVTLKDFKSDSPNLFQSGQPVYSPGYQVRVDSWRLCQNATPTTIASTNPAQPTCRSV